MQNYEILPSPESPGYTQQAMPPSQEAVLPPPTQMETNPIDRRHEEMQELARVAHVIREQQRLLAFAIRKLRRMEEDNLTRSPAYSTLLNAILDVQRDQYHDLQIFFRSAAPQLPLPPYRAPPRPRAMPMHDQA